MAQRDIRKMAKSPNMVRDVITWAKRKWGPDALYMLSDTHEGHEIWGVKATTQAVIRLERQARRQKRRRLQRRRR